MNNGEKNFLHVLNEERKKENILNVPRCLFKTKALVFSEKALSHLGKEQLDLPTPPLSDHPISCEVQREKEGKAKKFL